MRRILSTFKEKWPEYFLEILVLVIGIYGAFELENWNADRIEKNKANSYKTELVNELVAGKEHIRECIDFHQYKIALLNDFLSNYQKFDNPELIRANIEDILDSVNFKYFDPPRLVLDNLLTSGSIEHLPNIARQIQELINRYDQAYGINMGNVSDGLIYEQAFYKSIDIIAFRSEKPTNYEEHPLVADWYKNKDAQQYLHLLQYVAEVLRYHRRNLHLYPTVITKIENVQKDILQP